MTDPTLTPEVYGDYGLHLERMRRAPSNITVIKEPTMDEREEHVRRAREVIMRPDIHTRQVVRDAAVVLQAWGDSADQVMADAACYGMDREEWDEIDRRMSEPPTEPESIKYYWLAICGGMIASIGLIGYAAYLVASLP